MVYEPDPLLTSLALGRQREREAEGADAETPIDAELIERARQVLIPIARNSQRITYGQFAAQLGDPAVTALNAGGLLTMVCEVEGDSNAHYSALLLLVSTRNGRERGSVTLFARCADGTATMKRHT